jgi:DNA topoisomerase VI subunit B
VRLWFEDNGIGIPKDSQPRLFNIFTQLIARSFMQALASGWPLSAGDKGGMNEQLANFFSLKTTRTTCSFSSAR